MPAAVEAWFGSSAFAELHPLLQALHRNGGTLSGPVHIQYGRGLAGAVGRRIARALGIAGAPGEADRLTVAIRSEAGKLHWSRCFNAQAPFTSVFAPTGHYPAGHWVESSGRLHLHLGVAVVNGGWHWQHRGTRLWGIPLPRWMAPRTIAYKEIRDGRYHFHVQLLLPLLGPVLSYAGDLMPEPA